MDKKPRRFIIGGILWILLIWVWTYIYYYHPGFGTRCVKQPSPATEISSLKLRGKGAIIAESIDGKLFEFTFYNQIWTELLNLLAHQPLRAFAGKSIQCILLFLRLEKSNLL